MKRTLGTGALLVLTALTAACSFKIFEDLSTDPHPPTVAITGLVYYVEQPVAPPVPPPVPPAPDSDAVSQRIRAISWDSGGFTVKPDQLFQVGIAYTDAGGDIVKFHLRDRDGALNADIPPVDATYFSGTSGTLLGPEAGAAITGVFGRHRLELWAEDSHLSRSEKVEFVITLVP